MVRALIVGQWMAHRSLQSSRALGLLPISRLIVVRLVVGKLSLLLVDSASCILSFVLVVKHVSEGRNIM